MAIENLAVGQTDQTANCCFSRNMARCMAIENQPGIVTHDATADGTRNGGVCKTVDHRTSVLTD